MQVALTTGTPNAYFLSMGIDEVVISLEFPVEMHCTVISNGEMCVSPEIRVLP